MYLDTFSKITGTNGVSASTQILESSITLRYQNDAGVDTSITYHFNSGTLQEAMNVVNNSNWYVRAQISDDGKFEFVSRTVGDFDLSITMNINADGTKGDFGRVVGMATQYTMDFDPTQQRKDPATLTGGTTGLKLTDEIIGTNSITIWMTREREGFTGVDTQTGTGDLLSVAKTINFTDYDGDGYVSMADAINLINNQASYTKVKASIINGQFTLTQIDNLNADDVAKYNTNGGANTAGEGDTINYTLAGDGDFSYVTGFGSYTVSAQTDTGYMSNQAFSVLTGSTSVTGSEQILDSSITFTGLTLDNTVITKTISLSGTLTTAAQQITDAGLGVTAEIIDGKFVVTSDYFTELGLFVDGDSDFLRTAGLGAYSVAAAFSQGAAASDNGYHYHGVSTSTAILDTGTIVNGSLSLDGQSFDVVGKDVTQIVADINNSSVAHAQLQGNTLVIQLLREGALADAIQATGDAARVMGLNDYQTSKAEIVFGMSKKTGLQYGHVSYQVLAMEGGNSNSKLYDGYISFYVYDGDGTIPAAGSYITEHFLISVAGKTYQDIVNEINNNTNGVMHAELQGSNILIGFNWHRAYELYGYDSAKYINFRYSKDFARCFLSSGNDPYVMDEKGVTTTGTYMNHWNYTYDVWSEKTDNWDLSIDHASDDTPGCNTHYQYKTVYDYMYQTEIWQSRSWGWQRSNGNLSGDGYRNQWTSKSVETNYTNHTTQTYWGTDYTTYTTATYYTTSYWVSSYDYGTTVTGSSGYWDSDIETKTIQGGGTTGWAWWDDHVISAPGGWADYSQYHARGACDCSSPCGGTHPVYGWGDYSDPDSGAVIWWDSLVYTTAVSYYVEGNKSTSTYITGTNYGTSSWITAYGRSTHTDYYITGYGVSTETGRTSWYKGGYEERTQESKWESRDTGYNSTYNVNNQINESSTVDSEGHTRIRNQQTYSRAWYKETYWTKDSSGSYDTEVKDGYYDPGFKFSDSATVQYRNVVATHIIDSTSNALIKTAWGNTSCYGTRMNGIGHTYGVALSNLNFTLYDQQGGTVTLNSSRYGALGSFSYTSTDTLATILNKFNSTFANLQGLDGKMYSISVDSQGDIVTANGYFGKITISDTGNAMRVMALADSSAVGNATFDNAWERDYDITNLRRAETTLTSSLNGLSNSQVFAGQSSGTLSISVGGHAFNYKINYTSTTSIKDILDQINNMYYVVHTGEYTDSIFSDNTWANDSMCFTRNYFYSGSITGSEARVLENGALAGFINNSAAPDLSSGYDSSGSISQTSALEATFNNNQTGEMCYIEELQASIVDGRIVIKSSVYNEAESSIVISDTGNWAQLAGINEGSWSNSRTDTTNADWNGRTKNTATLTSSVGNMSADTIRPFQGSGSFYVHVGSYVAGKVTYNDTTTIAQIVEQINNMSFVYETGIDVTTPFTDSFAYNDNSSFATSDHDTGLDYDKNSFDTGNLEDGSTQSSFVQDGKVFYTAELQSYIDENGHIVIKSEVYDLNNTEITIQNDTADFANLVGLTSSDHGYSSNSVLVNGDEGIYTYTGAYVAGLESSSNLTFVGGSSQGFYVTLDDIVRTDTEHTVELVQRKFFVNVYEGDSVQNVLDRMISLANSNGMGLNFTANVVDNRIVITADGKYGEYIQFSDDTSDFLQRAGLSTVDRTTNEQKTHVIESYGYDRITGSVDTIYQSHVLGNLTSETFTISGHNGTYNVSITNGMSIADIISEIYSQTDGHYRAGIFNASETDYDNASVGSFYIESTAQGPTDTQVTSTDLTRRLGLVSVDTVTGASTQTFTGDHGYFVYSSADIAGLKANSVLSGIVDGKLTFTMHELSATGETGSITYRPTTTYTIDVAYNDTVQSVLNKMKKAILLTEDETLEHGDVIGQNRVERLDFHVEYDEATNLGHISLQIKGNYASEITFDNDTSGFMQLLGLDKIAHTYNADYTTTDVSSGKSMLTGSVEGIDRNLIFANMIGGDMTLTAGDVSKTITIKENDRVEDVINRINDGGVFEAGLNANGQLYVKTVGQNASEIEISGSTDFYKLVGWNDGSWSYEAETVIGNKDYSKITGSVYGLTQDKMFSNMTSGTFSISSAGLSTLNISVGQGVTTVGDVLAQINASSDYAAELDEAGRLVIHTTKTNGAEIEINEGTTDYTKVVGLTAGTLGGNAVFSSGVKDEYSTLQGSATGLDGGMRFSAGDFEISVLEADGSRTTVNFTLTGSETLADIAAKISSSELGISAVIDSTNGTFVLRSKTAAGRTIELKDGTSNFAELTGFTKDGAQASASVSGTLAAITGNQTAQSAMALGFSSGDFRISITDESGNVIRSEVYIISESDTLDSVMSKINASDLGVTASIDNNGYVKITRNANAQAGGLLVEKGTSDITNKLGFTQGGTTEPTSTNVAGTDSSRTVIKSLALGALVGDELSSLGVKSGDFRINGRNISVESSDTVAKLIEKINASFSSADDSGVFAEYIDGRIVVTSTYATGNNRIVFESGTSNVTDIFGFTVSGTLNEASQDVGVNAKYTLNGTSYESQSNYISLDSTGDIVETDSAAEAIRFTIKEVGSGTVDVGKQSLNDAYMKLNSFVNKFNNAMTLSNDPILKADSAFIALMGDIKNSLLNSVGDYKQMTRELSSIGITVYTTKTVGESADKVSLSVNKEKFVEAYLRDPDKVLDLLVGDDSQPIDLTKAGSLTRLQDLLSSAVGDYVTPTIKNLETQAKNLSYELANANSELMNIKASLAFDDAGELAAQDMSDYLAQLQEQYDSVNELIKKMKKQYNQSVTRMVLNG